MQIKKIEIKSEEDAWRSLQMALANEIGDFDLIEFSGWPVFKLTIEGKDFNGTIPTRIMPPILDLQREIHRIYCKAKYNTENTKLLKPDERDLLELIVQIKPGSTKFVTELFKALNEIIKNSHMTGTQATILLVSIAAMLTASVGWKDWLANRERAHGQEVTVQMSEQETERLKLVTEALLRTPELQENQQSINEFKCELSKKLRPSDQIKVDDQPVITGVRAAEIVPTPKKSSVDIRIDGEFVINEVKFPKSFGGDYRFSVTRVLDKKTFIVDATPDKLSPDQITVLKEGGFGVKKVLMEINAKELHGRVSSANLVSIRWPEENDD